MLTPKLYISKVTQTSPGQFVSQNDIDLFDHFKGAAYKEAKALEYYGKPQIITEKYPEYPAPQTLFLNTYESCDFKLPLYFFDTQQHTDQIEAITSVDNTYHSFVDFISGTFIRLKDNIRKRKVLLLYQDATTTKTDTLYGVIYKEVEFKFTNIFGKSFPLDNTDF